MLFASFTVVGFSRVPLKTFTDTSQILSGADFINDPCFLYQEKDLERALSKSDGRFEDEEAQGMVYSGVHGRHPGHITLREGYVQCLDRS